MGIKISLLQKKNMEQPSELESTYAAIVETKEELFEMISKKLSMSKDSEHTMATIVAVS